MKSTYTMPPTRHGLPAFECLSAMQKCIRRAMEREAMEFAVELIHTSKAYTTMVCNRLEIISHEDIDTVLAPHVVPFVRTACEQARQWYDPEKPDKSRMAIGNAIRMMAIAPKSREGDHFQAAIGLRSLLEDYCPTVPDWALDQHTSRGKRMGRGLQHFRDEGAKLVPAPERKDAYEEEAYRLWAINAKRRLAGCSTMLQPGEARPIVSNASPDQLGVGAAAAAEQGVLAFVSNVDGALRTPAERRLIAERLYGAGETMERIAKALRVNVATISRDLDGFCTVQKPPRPKGGRPRRPG
jgi:hypothetical protein